MGRIGKTYMKRTSVILLPPSRSMDAAVFNLIFLISELGDSPVMATSLR